MIYKRVLTKVMNLYITQLKNRCEKAPLDLVAEAIQWVVLNASGTMIPTEIPKSGINISIIFP